MPLKGVSYSQLWSASRWLPPASRVHPAPSKPFEANHGVPGKSFKGDHDPDHAGRWILSSACVS
ncbi:hypothetical protein QC761_0083180 [Podospora bellae-mahoneyi]|uniref:Uncharacterized protein n=1 Tax=Podospora bellae-mahoneyi TaxID=2093777 RepID=A0ABR0FEA7_9PEZI|nr:hypothetical protein QC761_0083180 [Podospora bellae-mahoneyi]